MATPSLSVFKVEPRVYGSEPFDLVNPISTNTAAGAIFTFSSSDTSVATISGRTVTILRAGQTVITATQAATLPDFTSASITANFTVNIATPTITNFAVSPKSFSDISFSLTPPTSNSSGAFTYRSLTPDIVTVTGTVVYIKKIGLARIEVNQYPVLYYYSQGSSIAEFDVLSSIVRVGVQNQIDLSWNRPTENGATVKNYFFYKEERITPVTPPPSVSTIIGGSSTSGFAPVTPTNVSYYSYALPRPYYSDVLSSGGFPTGIDINAMNQDFIISTSPTYTQANHIDLGYYGEIEISWVYHNDAPILELATNTVASTIMTLSIYKQSILDTNGNNGNTRVDLLLSIQRTYDSAVNCLGPRPQNNYKTMTDIFTISFADNVARELKYLKSTDVVSGKVQISNNTYSSILEETTTYSIILKSFRISPYRLPITSIFTSLGFGSGNANTGIGFAVSTVNAAEPLASSGILYHMPKMTRSMTDFNEAQWQFSWNYGANLTRLATDISYLPIDISGGSSATDILAAKLIIPFGIRLRAFSRPYSRVVSVEDYNTTDVNTFLTNVGDARYYTQLLLDVSWNDSATYAQIAAGTETSVSRTFDISGVSGFPAFSVNLDTSHTQFVFLFQLTITDPSYNAYFQRIATTAASASFAANDAFRVKMLSQTFTPRQEYQFLGPDPTLASSNALTSATNTVYEISNPYTNVRPFYRFYNLTNGVFYSYRIASNNRAGTTAFSELVTRRCGSVPNTIVNSVVAGKDTFLLESENTNNQINLYWVKPSFSGYEIEYFVIQFDIDISGRWLNFLDYTPDVSYNTLTFNRFEDIIAPIEPNDKKEHSNKIATYKNKNENSVNPLISGSKYYVRIASVNQLGLSAFSSILSGVVFARPLNAPVTLVGSPVIGNQLIYLTWKIPQDDAGSPILNYIIDYQKGSSRVVNGVTITDYDDTSNRYLIVGEPIRQTYPKDDFVEVYASYKKYERLSSDEQLRIRNLREELTRFVIPPTPITLRDSDYYVSRRDPSTGNLLSPIPNRSVILSYTQTTFSYIGDELKQNVFNISNIQLKWYYAVDSSGSDAWDTDEVSVSFKMSIRGHLKDISENSVRDISNIFYIPPDKLYTVNRTLFSTSASFKYIDYITGNVISNNDTVPKIIIPSLPLIDTYNNARYKLQIDYEITEFQPNTGGNRFFIYSGPIVINGIAPVRTHAGLNTIFTLKIQNNAVSPILNNTRYRFTITPFNLNDYFTATSVEELIGTDIADPVTEMSYSLISTSQGGIVRLQWKYSPISDYYIKITIPDQYQNGNEEYQLVTDSGGIELSIFAKTLTPVNNIVTYNIPSSLPADIATGTAQSYLKAGRGYTISVAPVKIVEVANDFVSLPASSRNITPDGVYIIPFRVPLRPIGFAALGNNGAVALSWRLPNLVNDPNYYITAYEADPPLPYYRYRFYSLERRDVSAVDINARDWVVVAAEISIPDGSATGAGAVMNYTVTGLTNENNHQFRVRLMIINDYNSQRALSDYTYLTNINAVSVTENSGNTVYPSIYPYKPTRPLLRFASRGNSDLKELIVSFENPSYSGNADYYNVFIEYTPPVGVSGSGITWNDIFSTTPGVRIATQPSVTLRTTNAVVNNPQLITVNCIGTVIDYGIRIRLIGRKNGLAEPYPYTLYSDYSDIDFIDL